MSATAFAPIANSDHYIAGPYGTLFARIWEPATDGARDAAPLLLFHESTGSVEQWRDFPARLAAVLDRRVIAYDRLGFGRSDANPEKLGQDFMGDEARDALPALFAYFEIDRFAALGHSVGGEIAVASAAALPGQAEAVITISAQSFVEELTLDGVRAAKLAFADPERFARVERHHGDKARWVLDAWFDTWLDPAFADWSLDTDLARLACPIMAIHGDQDEFGSAAHPRRITKVPTSPTRLELLPGVGHIPYREQPELILALVKDFLDSVVRT